MKQYYNVTYKVADDIWSANLVHAESPEAIKTAYIADKRKHVKSPGDIIIREADEYAVESAQRRHMPIVEV